MQIKRFVPPTSGVPVTLQYAPGQPNAGQGITGLTNTQVTLYMTKAGGAATLRTLTAPEWLEVDAAHQPGKYLLLLQSGDYDTSGLISFAISSATSSVWYREEDEVVPNTVADVYTLLSTAYTLMQTVAGLVGLNRVIDSVVKVAGVVQSMRTRWYQDKASADAAAATAPTGGATGQLGGVTYTKAVGSDGNDKIETA